MEIEKVHGYKITGLDLKCRGKQYSCPGEFEEDLEPMLCKQGMHFSEKLIDALRYAPIVGKTYNDGGKEFYVIPIDFADAKLLSRVFEVESCGLVDRGDDKVCTNKLKFIRELCVEEIIKRLTFEAVCTYGPKWCDDLVALDGPSTHQEWVHTMVLMMRINCERFEKERLERANKKGE